MLKNIQIKIVMIFAILGIIVISGLGIFSLYRLDIIISNLSASQIEIKSLIMDNAENIKIAIYTSLLMFLLFTIIGGFLVTKVVLNPISKLIKSAEMVSRKKKYLSD